MTPGKACSSEPTLLTAATHLLPHTPHMLHPHECIEQLPVVFTNMALAPVDGNISSPYQYYRWASSDAHQAGTVPFLCSKRHGDGLTRFLGETFLAQHLHGAGSQTM